MPTMNKLRFLPLLLALVLILPDGALASSAQAPTDFHDGNYSMDVTFCLPSVIDGELVSVTDSIRLSTSFSPEEAVLRHLMEYPADEQHRALPGDGIVQLADGESYINSCGTAVINFTEDYEALDASARYLLAQCVTNTLCGLGRVRAVVFLCQGHPVSLSDDEEIPAGAFRASERENLPLIQAQLMARRSEGNALRYSADTALYYPAPAGHGIVCETRSVTFPEPGEEQAVLTLLEALSMPPQELAGIPEMPMLTDYLTRSPEIIPLDDDTHAISLRFSEELNQQVSTLGILRSVLLAGITTTIVSFLPDTSAVICYIGAEQVGGLVPVGLYERGSESIIFSGGRMRWQDFTYFQLTSCRLYFPNDRNELVESIRLVPAAWADYPDRIIGELISGPDYYDSVSDLHGAFPAACSLDDVLGIGVRNHTCQINLSDSILEKCAGFSDQEERNLVYSLVNVLTDLPWCKRVELFVAGEQPETFLSQIYLPGDFMRYTDYIPALQ